MHKYPSMARPLQNPFSHLDKYLVSTIVTEVSGNVIGSDSRATMPAFFRWFLDSALSRIEWQAFVGNEI